MLQQLIRRRFAYLLSQYEAIEGYGKQIKWCRKLAFWERFVKA